MPGIRAAMWRYCMCSVALVAWAALVAGSALAGPRITSKTVYFSVRGATAGALYYDVLRNGPRGKSGRALATTRAVISQHAEFRRGRRCRLDRYRLDLKLITHLPRLAGKKRLSGTVRRSWNNFSSYIRRHEATHSAIYRRCARKIDVQARRISRKSATCGALRASLKRMFRKELAKCETLHARYDAREKARIRRLSLVVRAIGPRRAAKRRSTHRKRSARRK